MKSAHPLQQEELMAYLDGELRPELAMIAAAHLEHCAECRATAAEIREMSQQLAAWEIQMSSPELPATLGSAVDAHVKAQKKRNTDHRRSWQQILGTKRLGWALGAVFAVFVLALLFTPSMMRSNMGSERSAAFARLQSVPAKVPEGRAASGGLGNGATIDLNDRYMAGRGSLGKLEKNKSVGVVNGQLESDGSLAEREQPEAPAPNGPMIVRTAELTLTTRDFDKARSSAQEILKRYGGYIGELTVNAPANSGRTLTATFRVPADHLDAAMAELKKLGRVESESQGGEEVTQQYVDLQARLANARHTEQRLSDLLSNRTGKLSDVLAFEKEIDRVRGEIESMEAQRKSIAKQVTYATLSTTVTEEYKTPLQVAPPSTSTLFHNAAVDGYRAVADSVVSVLLFLLSAGPSLLIWGGILFVIGRIIWKKLRRKIA